jgi:hypothetical protein
VDDGGLIVGILLRLPSGYQVRRGSPTDFFIGWLRPQVIGTDQSFTFIGKQAKSSSGNLDLDPSVMLEIWSRKKSDFHHERIIGI